MNTSVDAMAMDAERPRTPRVAPHATHKLKLLLRREFWEHKGGFFWAPIWAGGISLLLTLMALVVGEVAAFATALHWFGRDPLTANDAASASLAAAA